MVADICPCFLSRGSSSFTKRWDNEMRITVANCSQVEWKQRGPKLARSCSWYLVPYNLVSCSISKNNVKILISIIFPERHKAIGLSKLYKFWSKKWLIITKKRMKEDKASVFTKFTDACPTYIIWRIIQDGTSAK